MDFFRVIADYRGLLICLDHHLIVYAGTGQDYTFGTLQNLIFTQHIQGAVNHGIVAAIHSDQ